MLIPQTKSVILIYLFNNIQCQCVCVSECVSVCSTLQTLSLKLFSKSFFILQKKCSGVFWLKQIFNIFGEFLRKIKITA